MIAVKLINGVCLDLFYLKIYRVVKIMNKFAITINDDQQTVKLPKGIRLLLRKCCFAVLEMEKFESLVEINISFVDNKKIQELNKIHRGIDSPTDVLSFPLGENGNYDTNPETGRKILGDIVISLEKAVEQAKEFSHSLQREMAYLTAHSVLHLLGYDHQNKIDKLRMREKEEYVMKQLGLQSTSTYVL